MSRLRKIDRGRIEWKGCCTVPRLFDTSDLPLRAIVKDFAPGDNTWSPKGVRKMLKDLKRIREQGLYVMDIKADNYKEGLLVDFSIAMTLPHFLFEIKPRHMVRGYMNQDLLGFDEMVEEQKVKTPLRAFRNMETMKKLRSYEKWLWADSEDEDIY